MKPRQIFSIVLGIILLSIVGLFGLMVLQSMGFVDLSKMEDETARQKWSNRTFSKYRLTVNSSRIYMGGCIYDIEVQDEQVLSKYSTDTCPPEETRYTVTGLFNWMMEHNAARPSFSDGCIGYPRLFPTYDINLGYPHAIKWGYSGEKRWLYHEFWTNLIGQTHCNPNSTGLVDDMYMTASQEIEVTLLQPLP